MSETIRNETVHVTQSQIDIGSSLKTGRGALTLGLLLLVQFLDFLDVSVVNVALPSIKHELDFSGQDLQWVSGYVSASRGWRPPT